ncbi:MAG: alpha/beta hydrolase [Ilumatobacter sp.]|nr:alpha/beta hydrolase [Ilumatobacter sp.]
MASSLLFVHSPLVGPSSWARVAKVARDARGGRVTVPDLTGIASMRQEWTDWYVTAAARAATPRSGEVVVVGHSGAGVFLPAIAAELGARATIFVDAVVPPGDGPHHTSPALAELLDRQTDAGLLRPWLDWWPDDVVERLLPDGADRAALRADMPRLPRAFYDEPVAVPDGWTDRPNCYVQLSPAYDDDRRRAHEWGWPVSAFDGTHLSVITDPGRVFAAIVDVVEQIARPT